MVLSPFQGGWQEPQQAVGGLSLLSQQQEPQSFCLPPATDWLRSSCFLGAGLLTDNNRSDGQRLFLDLFEQVAGKQPGIVGFHHFGILYGCRKEEEQSTMAIMQPH